MTEQLSEKLQLASHLLSLFMQDQEFADYLAQEAKENEALRVSVRIVVDFWHFLKTPPPVIQLEESEVSYLNDTLRSGLDFFYELRDLESVLTNRRARVFEWQHYDTFAALRAEFLKEFDIFRQEHMSTQERFYALLVLIRLALIFWATTFVE